MATLQPHGQSTTGLLRGTGRAGGGSAAATVRTSRTPQPVTSANASITMGTDILDSPAWRSTNATGISTTASLPHEPVGHLDLEAVAVGAHVVEVERRSAAAR